MPKILDKYVKGLRDKGVSESSAYAIATSSLQKKGIFKKGTRRLNTKTKRKKIGDSVN